MKYARTTPLLLLTILLIALAGCNSKKDKAAQTPPQQKVGAVTATPQDEADASVLKARVLAHLKAGDFSAIYREASAGFREVGPEQKFTALWQRQLQDTGAFKEAKEINHTVRPADGFLIYIYDVQYEKKHKALRLTFGRSKKGVTELTGINQSDLPKAGK